MKKKTLIATVTLLAIGVGEVAFIQSANAFNFMNPFDWFSSDRHRYYDDDYYYDRGPWGYRRGYGPGWGGPGWGYSPAGWPGYGWPGIVAQTKSEPAPEHIPE